MVIIIQHLQNINNIFSNRLIENTILGNLTATTSHHLPQFIILPSIFSNFVQENFVLDYFSVN